MDAATCVLKQFSSTEVQQLPVLLGDVIGAVETFREQGSLQVQQKYHPR